MRYLYKSSVLLCLAGIGGVCDKFHSNVDVNYPQLLCEESFPSDYVNRAYTYTDYIYDSETMLWLMIDLGTVYRTFNIKYNIEGARPHVFILVTHKDTADEPSPTSPDWITVYSHKSKDNNDKPHSIALTPSKLICKVALHVDVEDEAWDLRIYHWDVIAAGE